MINNDKYRALMSYLKRLGKVVIAFSGGVDSTFLLKVAKEALGEDVKAITIASPYIPKWEIAEAKALIRELGVKHEIIEAPIIESIKYNPEDRCYLCKTAVFNMILEVAKKEGYDCVVDGTNFDDIKDYRPGLRALKELEVRSPLLECELTKADIREFSHQLGLDTWDKPAYACLLTRIPYGNELLIEDFEKIEKAERFMMSIGFRAVRVRCHGDLARVEVSRKDRHKVFNEELLDTIAHEIKACGFKYVTLDLQGYRVGSFNETMVKKDE